MAAMTDVAASLLRGETALRATLRSEAEAVSALMAAMAEVAASLLRASSSLARASAAIIHANHLHRAGRYQLDASHSRRLGATRTLRGLCSLRRTLLSHERQRRSDSKQYLFHSLVLVGIRVLTRPLTL